MAKRLGFGPHSLIRNRPDPRQKWKLPVKYWIHEQHFKRFGYVQGEKPTVPSAPDSLRNTTKEAARLFGGQLHQKWDPNPDEAPFPHPTGEPQQAAISDDDVPF